MTQEAECEKTRAPNHLFARLRKTGDDKREGIERAEHLDSDDVLLETPLTDIYKHNGPFFSFFFLTQYVDDTLFCCNRFSSSVSVQRLETVQFV